VAHGQDARYVPEDGPRLVEDRRSEAGCPRPGRSLDTDLCPAEPLELGRDERAVVGQGSADLGERVDRLPLAAAGPAQADL
ncbi:MAG: hypothetical protein ACXWNG_07565, partial [Candidatus Limnocylindrales bacterium]